MKNLDNQPDDKLFSKAFQLLEREKAEEMLRQHGIQRSGKIVRYDFRKKFNAWWMAAAILVIALSSLYLYQQMTPLGSLQLAENALSSVSSDYNFSVRSTDLPKLMLDVQMAFNKKDWTTMDTLLEEALSQSDSIDAQTKAGLHFYLGVSALQQDHFADAVLHFDPVIQTAGSVYARDAVWLRGLAHLKNNRLDLALIDLNATAREKDWTKSKEASMIIHALEDER